MRIYSRPIDVVSYPRYEKRNVRVPSLETFGGRTRFICLRYFAQADGLLTDYERELDAYIDRFALGSIVWPHVFLYKARNLPDLVMELKRRGLYLFDVWGFVPMVDPGVREFGQIGPPPEVLRTLEEGLGDRFLGIDNGEQDGRYVWVYTPLMCPAPQDRGAQYLNFSRHFERMEEELGNKVTALVSLTAGHYFAKAGNTMLIGAEAAQALPNSQVYYAFLRGAGKQYGIHWFGNASVFNRWAWKNYDHEDTRRYPGRFLNGPEEGTSLSLLKRIAWTHIMYNCVAFGIETSLLMGEYGRDAKLEEKPPAIGTLDYGMLDLSPVGRVQAEAKAIVDRRDPPGTQVTPLAFLLDFNAGWVMPRHLYTRNVYQIWGSMPYGAGDYLTHQLIDMVYPGYVDSGFYRDERGFLSPTPFGDILDVLLNDVSPEVLRRYDTVVVAGTIESLTAETADLLYGFAEAGGTVVITAANVLRLGLAIDGLETSRDTMVFDAGTAVDVGGTSVPEQHSFELYRCTARETGVTAWCRGMPAAYRTEAGKGEFVVLLSPMGLTSERLSFGTLENEEERPLADVFVLNRHVRMILEGLFSRISPFSIADGLSYVCTRKQSGLYELLILNNSMESAPLDIRSNVGSITAREEVVLGTDMSGVRGYKPTGFADRDIGVDTADRIAGLSVRLFDLSIDERAVEEVKESPFQPVRPAALDLGNCVGIREAVLSRPTFDRHFQAVKVSWRYLHAADPRSLEEEGLWLSRRSIGLLVDFTDGLNNYPDLTLHERCPGQWERSLSIFEDVLEKLGRMGGGDAVLRPSAQPRYIEKGESIGLFGENLRSLCDFAGERGIRLHLQSRHTGLIGSTAELLGFIRSLGCGGLSFALSVSHILIEGLEPSAILEEAGDLCRLILVSAPFEDPAGQMYDAHRPFRHRAADTVRGLADASGGRMIVLDAVYADQADEYLDIRLIEEFGAPGSGGSESAG